MIGGTGSETENVPDAEPRAFDAVTETVYPVTRAAGVMRRFPLDTDTLLFAEDVMKVRGVPLK